LFYTDREPDPERAGEAPVGEDRTAIIPYDDGRPATLTVRAGGFAPAFVRIQPGQREATVELSRGVQVEADVRVAGRLFSREDRGGLAFVRRGFGLVGFVAAQAQEDGRIAVRLMPGDYGVYLMAPKAWKWAFHLEDITVEGDVKMTYHFASFDELETRKVNDDLVPVRKKKR
jgi:hypothetical protein